MFDPQEILKRLTEAQRVRLQQLLEARNRLPWEAIDEELLTLRLVQPGSRIPDETTLNNWGWKVAMLL